MRKPTIAAIRAISFALILYTLVVEMCLIYCVLTQNEQFESITIFGLIGCIVLSIICDFCFELANRLEEEETNETNFS